MSNDAPLCPALYQILAQRFGRVTIANPREPFVGVVARDVQGRGQTRVRSAGEYYCVNCPFCRDRRRRLWVNHTYGQLEPDGRPRMWAAVCYNESCMQDYERRQQFYDMTLGFQNQRGRGRPLVIEAVPADDTLFRAETPGEIAPITRLPPSHRAVRYLAGRPSGCYTPELLDAYEIGYVTNATRFPVMQDRIYFPVKMHGQLVGWQGRIVEKSDPGPKYSSMPRMKRRLCLYNYDRAKHAPFVVVVEGPTDTHVLPDYAVGVMGKGVAAPQASLLCMTWGRKPIFVMFDGEAADTTYHTALEIAALRGPGTGPVIPVYLPGATDPGDYTTAALYRIVQEAASHYRVSLPDLVTPRTSGVRIRPLDL